MTIRHAAQLIAFCITVSLGADQSQSQQTVQSIAESAKQSFSELTGVHTNADKLEVTVHQQQEDYSEIDKQLSGGRFAENLAFAWPTPPQAHILYQPASAAVFDKLPFQTKRLIAHEATHLARYQAFPNHKSHPRWFADGLGQLNAARVVGVEPFRPAVAITDPWSSTSARRVKENILTRSGLTAFVEDDGASLNNADRYHMARVVAEYLSHQKTLGEVASAARRLGGGSGFNDRLVTEIRPLLDDELFEQYVRSLSPQWDEVYRSLDTSSTPWHQAAFNSTNAIAFATTSLRPGDWSLNGSVEVADVGGRQMNILVGETDQGFISVALGPSFGVIVFRYNSQHNTWTRVTSAKVPAFKLGEPLTFSIRCKGDRLAITLDQNVTLEVELEGTEKSGRWGLGAQTSSAGRWSDIIAR